MLTLAAAQRLRAPLRALEERAVEVACVHRFPAPPLLSSEIRRTFTLLYTPMRTDRAARDIRKKKTEYQDVHEQEAEITAGHGVLRCTGLVAVSASDPDELERAIAAVEQAAIQTSRETRRL